MLGLFGFHKLNKVEDFWEHRNWYVIDFIKELFFDGLKAIAHSNPSKVWKDVRDYGRENRYGKPVADTAEGGEGEAEGGDASHNRSPELRNLEELLVLYKFNRRQESLSDKLNKVQLKIGEALQEMGVDLHMIAD